MRGQNAKLSFSAGVLSPRLSLRADVDTYSTGLRQSTNFIVSPQGGIVMREGFENIAPASVLSEQNRIFQFHKGGETSDMLVEVSAGYGLVHFYIDGVEQVDTVAHNYTLAQLEDLYFTNQEKMAIICHAAHPPLYIEIALDGSISGSYLKSNLVPLADYQDENSPTAKTTGDSEYVADWINGTDSTTWNPSRNWILSYDGVYAVGNQGNPKEFEFSQVALTLASRITEALNLIPALKGADTTISVVPAGSVY